MKGINPNKMEIDEAMYHIEVIIWVAEMEHREYEKIKK